jgi:hypothetical protein
MGINSFNPNAYQKYDGQHYNPTQEQAKTAQPATQAPVDPHAAEEQVHAHGRDGSNQQPVKSTDTANQQGRTAEGSSQQARGAIEGVGQQQGKSVQNDLNRSAQSNTQSTTVDPVQKHGGHAGGVHGSGHSSGKIAQMNQVVVKNSRTPFRHMKSSHEVMKQQTIMRDLELQEQIKEAERKKKLAETAKQAEKKGVKRDDKEEKKQGGGQQQQKNKKQQDTSKKTTKPKG